MDVDEELIGEEEMVSNEEIVYRRVQSNATKTTPAPQYEIEDGVPKVTRMAFSDRLLRPSVDRALLCNNDPIITRGEDVRDGVVSLPVEAIRRIDTVVRQVDPPQRYGVDVIAARLEHNPAHAEVRTAPALEARESNLFKKLTTALVLIARDRWEITPQD